MARKRFKREIQTTTIDKLSHDGRGICQQDGKTTFVMGALPGETVSYRPMRSQKGIIEAVTTEVHKPANERQDAICQHFTQCGGCQLQHTSSEAQVANGAQPSPAQPNTIDAVHGSVCAMSRRKKKYW